MSAEQLTIGGNPVTEETIFDARVDARVFVPWLRLFDFVDEYRVEIDWDGFHVNVVDAATVMVAKSTLFDDAFETFDVSEETAIGINAKRLNAAVSFARYGKGASDSIRLTLNERKELTVTVNRDIEGVSVVGERSFGTMPPDDLRDEQDMPSIQQKAEATLPPEVFVRLVNELNDRFLLQIDHDGVAFLLGEETDGGYRADVSTRGESLSWFSHDYMEEMANAINASLADSLTILNSDEHPIEVYVDREGVFKATFMQAPRIAP